MNPALHRRSLLAVGLLVLAACGTPSREVPPPAAPPASPEPSAHDAAAVGLAKYATVRLTSDLGRLTPRQREMLLLLIDAARIMDELFWLQAYGQRGPFLDAIGDPDLRRFAEINYGPWDRLDGASFFFSFHFLVRF